MRKQSNITFLWGFLRPYLGFFVLAILCSMAYTCAHATIPQVISITVDSVLGVKEYPFSVAVNQWLEGLRQTDLLLLAAGAVLVASVVSGLFNFGSRVCASRCSEGFVKGMRDALFGHIQRLPFQWHTQNQTGEIIQRCTSDVGVIQSFVTKQFLEVFRIVILIITYLTIMFAMDGSMAVITLCFVPLMICYSLFFYRKIATRFLAADEAEGELSTAIQENLTGVRVVRAFGREQFEMERFDEKNHQFSQLWIQLGKLLSLYWSSADLITGTQILVVLVAGVQYTVAGSISPGELLAFLSYNAAMIWPVRSLGRILSEMSKASVSVERVAEILNAEEEVQPEKPVTADMSQDIVFDHVTFGYPGLPPVLKDLSFTIPAGATVGMLGSTGSGKSTLVHLLNRLYDVEPDQGRITIGGVDIRDIPQDYLRRQVGLVLQEPFLFSRTIEENIKATNPQATLEQVRQAAKVACVDSAMAEMSLGYDTMVGERGVTLSGGQKQRVAIARMLMGQPPVMIFDDSLSAVDAETDAQIRAQLKEQEQGRTVLLISHRVISLMQADYIIVLQEGQVAESGTHSQLLAHSGIYRRIYDIQMTIQDRLLLEGGVADGTC